MYYTTQSILLVNAYLLEVMAEYARVVDADRCSVLSTIDTCTSSSFFRRDGREVTYVLSATFTAFEYFLHERRSRARWQKWFMGRWCFGVWQV